MVVLVVLVVQVVLVVVLWAMLLLALGLQLRLGFGLGFGDRFDVEEDLVPEVWEGRFRVGGFPGMLPGCRGGPRGGRGGPRAACFVAAALDLTVALWIKSAVTGKGEVEDDDEDEDEEEAVVLEDAGCADMLAGTASRAVSTSAAATASKMEAISSGFWSRAGGFKGPATIRLRGGLMRWASVCGGGVGLRRPPSGFGWARLLQFARVCASASAGGNSSRGLHWGVGRFGLRVMGL